MTTILNKFQNLPEVIAEEDFHNLFNELIKNAESISAESKIELLNILGDRFGKFYDDLKLDPIEKAFISQQLIKLTQFTDINRICELTGLMFSFSDDTYSDFLSDRLKTKHLTLNVRTEIEDSIGEFKKSDSQ